MIPLGSKVFDNRRPMIRGRLVSCGKKMARMRLPSGQDYRLPKKHVQPMAWVAIENWHKHREAK